MLRLNTPKLATEVTLQVIRRIGLDAAIPFADLPRLAAALRRTWNTTRARVPCSRGRSARAGHQPPPRPVPPARAASTI